MLGSEKDESMNWLPGRMRRGVMPACTVVEGGRLANAIMVVIHPFVFVSALFCPRYGTSYDIFSLQMARIER
jgi:hypothetical protein